MAENTNPIELLLYHPKEDSSSLTKNIEEAIIKIIQDLALGKYSENEAIAILYDCRIALAKGTDTIKEHYNENSVKYLSKFLIDKYAFIYNCYDLVNSNGSINPDEKKKIILYN